MTRLVTAYTKPTQDTLSEGSAAIMDGMVPMTMTMTMAVSAVTTVTTVVGFVVVAASRRAARYHVWRSVLGLGRSKIAIPIGLVARAVHDRLMPVHG
jgi:succinate dehydrogenase hydrophobic anchor subunit